MISCIGVLVVGQNPRTTYIEEPREHKRTHIQHGSTSSTSFSVQELGHICAQHIWHGTTVVQSP